MEPWSATPRPATDPGAGAAPAGAGGEGEGAAAAAPEEEAAEVEPAGVLNTLAAVTTYGDGREILAITFDSNAYSLQTLLFGYGLVNWVTRGLFIGERHVHMSPQVDDLFIDDDQWTNGTSCALVGKDRAADSPGSTVRMTGVSKGAILRLLVEVGTACAEYQNITLRNIPAKRAIANLHVPGAVGDAAARASAIATDRAATHCQRCTAPNKNRIIIDSPAAALSRVTGHCGITHNCRYGAIAAIVDDPAAVVADRGREAFRDSAE